MKIKDNEILHKIINLQSCIIGGRNINAMLHKDKKFYQDSTQANMIAVYVNENENVNLEYILEDHNVFNHLAKKYIFSNKHLKWDHFTKNCKNYFSADNRYHHTNNLSELFNGIILKKDVIDLSNELKINDAVTMPIYTLDNTKEIGYICFMFQKKVKIEIEKLEEVKSLFEKLLQPLYDNQYNIIYTKCVRVDEHFKLLTEQEKRIVKKVLHGVTYPEIAEILNLSVNTIKTHMKHIFSKYQVNSKIELYKKLNAHTY